MSKYLRRTLTLIGLLTLPVTYTNAAVINDDQLVEGDLCVGYDCVNGEAFTDDILRLKENNVRIRLIDTSAVEASTESWNIEANDSKNGGDAYLSLEIKSLTQDQLVLSDGNAALWDCSVYPPVDTGELIPAGEPIMAPYSCEPVYEYAQTPYALFTPQSDGGVTLGFDSEIAVDAISVGNEELTRMLINVAQGMAETDLLTKGTMDSAAANALALKKLEKIEKRIARIERLVGFLTKFKARFPYAYAFIKKIRARTLKP